jgi:hypothetical protein
MNVERNERTKESQMTQRPQLRKMFASVCPPHRTTDAQYAEWVRNCAAALELDDRPDVTEAEKRSRQAWRDEAAVWSAYEC